MLHLIRGGDLGDVGIKPVVTGYSNKDAQTNHLNKKPKRNKLIPTLIVLAVLQTLL